MSTSNEKAIEEKIPWCFLIPFMIVLGAFTATVNPLNVSSHWMRPSAWIAAMGTVVICYFCLTALPFISFWFAGVFGRLSFFRKRINLTTTTWLYAMTLCLSFYLGRPNLQVLCTNYGAFINNRIMSPITEELVPWFLAPPRDVARKVLLGGVPTPWADLMPVIIFFWIFQSVWGLLMLSVATLFRKHWIDVEKMPFPHVLVAHELLVRVVPERKRRLESPFMLGLILGVAVWIPMICIELFPWFPDIYGVRANNCGYASYVVQPGEPLAALAGMARIGREPLGVAVAYFAPLSTLFNIWFWWLVMLILIQVAYTFGYYTGILDYNGCCRVWYGEKAIAFGEPFKWAAITSGGIYSLAIFLLILSRGYIKDTFKAAFGKGSLNRAEFEKGEPISYRATYILLIATSIVMVIMYIITGINPLSALLTVINGVLVWIASLRMLGIGGMYYKGIKMNALHRLFIWPNAPETLNRDFVLSAYFNAWFLDAPEFGYIVGGNFLSAFESYKMASITGVSTKSIFKILVASILIYSLVTMLAYFNDAYTFGATQAGFGFNASWCDHLLNRIVTPWNGIPGTEPWIPHFVTGFVSVGLVSWLHFRYIWFPFEPVGFLLGISTGFEFGLWSYALIAWILKMLTLRIGGSKAYEEFGAPMAGGYMAGHMLALIPGIILQRVRFFFPF